MPAVMLALNATYQVARQGRRAPHPGARRSTRAPISPRSQPGEILTAIRIPVPPAGHGYAYEKLKRKIGDYATAAAAVILTMDGGSSIGSCAIALTNVADTPLYAEEAASDPRHRLEARRRDREAGRRGRRGDHRAGLRPARHAAYRTKMAGVMLRARARAAPHARA